jgi:hypothetical protein
LASAALQQLLQPQLLLSTTTSTAADLLVLLADELASSMEQQQQQSQAVDSAAILQQCLRCMLLLQQDPRGLQPGQLTAVLSALLQLQQLHQQHQSQQKQQLVWQLSLDNLKPQQQGVAAVAAAAALFAQLQQEALVAVGLQLEDSARYLSSYQLSECVRLLALLHSRPQLALAAVVSAASGRHERFSLGQLVWLLWGLTKLRFTREAGFVRMLKAAVDRTVAKRDASTPAAAATSSGDVQTQAAAEDEADSSAAQSSSDSSSSSSAEAAAAADSAAAAAVLAPLHQLVALLWVATSRGYQSPELALLLQQILTHPEAPSLPQASSVAWSYARMSSYGMQQQLQQLQPQLLEWLEQHCSSSSSSSEAEAEAEAVAVPVQSVVNIAWAVTKLGGWWLLVYCSACSIICLPAGVLAFAWRHACLCASVCSAHTCSLQACLLCCKHAKNH